MLWSKLGDEPPYSAMPSSQVQVSGTTAHGVPAPPMALGSPQEDHMEHGVLSVAG